MTTLIQDLKYAVRLLVKNPGFTAVAVLSLALGIGANTAIFSLIDALMLKSLPVRQPEQLVLLKWVSRGWPYFIKGLDGEWHKDEAGRSTSASFSYPVFEAIRTHHETFSDVMGFADADRLSLNAGGQSGLAKGQYVSGDYFSTLGVRAVLGRTIVPSDDTAGAAPVAVISYAYWTSRFGRDPSVAGKAITVNGVPFTLVGVTAPEFFGLQSGRPTDTWIPLQTHPQVDPAWSRWLPKGESSLFSARSEVWVLIMGRLKPGVTGQQARAALDVIVQQNAADIELPPPSNRTPDMALEPPKVELTPASGGLDALRRQFSQPLFVLMSVVGLVLLIACANVANLLLARAESRQKEIAVRLALGAGRRRLIRQLLTESVLLAVAGGTLGVLLAYWASDVLLAFMSSGGDPIQLSVSPDLRVLGFTALVSVLTGILFGLTPALRGTRLDLTPALKDGAGRVIGGARRAGRMGLGFGRALVVSQTAMSLLLLIGAGLFVRTLGNLEKEDLGFDRSNLLLFAVDPSRAGYKDERLVSLYREMQRRIEAIPGVRSASLSRHALINDGRGGEGVSIQGYDPKPGEIAKDGTLDAYVHYVAPRFLETYRIPLLLGRTIGDGDTGAAPKVALVNRAFVRRYLGNTNPVGRRFGFGDATKSSEIAIVGVVADTKYDELRDEPPVTVYVPYTQHLKWLDAMSFGVRTAGDPNDWIGPVRQVVQGLDRNLPVFSVMTQTEQIDQATFQERLFARLTSFFALLALVLACVGLYGMMSYAVARRTNEIGIRMALGAERVGILRMVLREGLGLTVLGGAIGISAALAASRLISTMLYGVKPTDPVTLAACALLMIAVAALAGYLPARRASRVNPMVALRYE